MLFHYISSMAIKKLPTLYNLKSVSKMFGVSRQTLYAWNKKGTLKFIKIGGSVRVPDYELLRVSQDNTEK